MTPTLQILRIVLIVQMALLGISTLESLVLGGPASLIVPGLGTAALAYGIRRLATIPKSAVRVIRITEWSILVTAAVNTLLAIFLARRLLEPMVLTTSVIAPIVALRLLKRSLTPPPFLNRKELAHGAH